MNFRQVLAVLECVVLDCPHRGGKSDASQSAFLEDARVQFSVLPVPVRSQHFEALVQDRGPQGLYFAEGPLSDGSDHVREDDRSNVVRAFKDHFHISAKLYSGDRYHDIRFAGRVRYLVLEDGLRPERVPDACGPARNLDVLLIAARVATTFTVPVRFGVRAACAQTSLHRSRYSAVRLERERPEASL